MKLVLFFLATSALFTAAAIPMQASQGSSSEPDPDYVPKVDFRDRHMYSNDKTVAKGMIIDHYIGLEAGNEQKAARLAYAKKGWRNGKGPDDRHRQYLNFDYHRGDTPNSAKIGQTVIVSRDRPPPQPHFKNTIPLAHRPEMAREMTTKYKALPPHRAEFVKSMRALGDWGDGPGLREETQFAYHSSIIPASGNILGNPVTIYRPMSFLIDGNVPKEQAPVIKKRIREEHEKLDENHPLKQANYGVVTEGWQKPQRKGQHVGATLYKVKDKLSVSAEEDFKKIGDFHVNLGKGRRSEAQD